MGHRSIANTVVYTAMADKRIRNIRLGQMSLIQGYPSWRSGLAQSGAVATGLAVTSFDDEGGQHRELSGG
jgi:hypothetical protein